MKKNNRAALRMAWPWMLAPLVLWGVQVWAISGSNFSMAMTLLQAPFVLVFMVVIYVIAYHRVTEPE